MHLETGYFNTVEQRKNVLRPTSASSDICHSFIQISSYNPSLLYRLCHAIVSYEVADHRQPVSLGLPDVLATSVSPVCLAERQIALVLPNCATTLDE
jgi:hypothetical protein